MINTRIISVPKENGGGNVINNIVNNATTSNVDNGEFVTINADSANITNLTSTTINAANVNATEGDYTNLTVDESFDAGEVNADELNATNGTITTLSSTTATITTASGTTLNYQDATISNDLNVGNDVTINGDLHGTYGEFSTVDATTIDTSNINVDGQGTFDKSKNGSLFKTVVQGDEIKLTKSSSQLNTTIAYNNISTPNVDTNNINSNNGNFDGEVYIENATIQDLLVTGSAHFFELIIDKIKATQGQIIITPANAKILKVEETNGYYKCYYQATDAEGNAIYNPFCADDLVVCQNFNVNTGLSTNVSNKFYWMEVESVEDLQTETITVNGADIECWSLMIPTNAYKHPSSNGVPEAGDEIVQLGNTSDTDRQSAIIISAYRNQYLDPTIIAPSIVQYNGIKSYDLTTKRVNVMSKGLNEFKGNFKTSTGEPIGQKGDKGDKGDTGANAEEWIISPNREEAYIDTDGNLDVHLGYELYHVQGNERTVQNISSDGYHFIVYADKADSQHSYFLMTSSSISKNNFITDYYNVSSANRPSYFKVYLCYGTNHEIVNGVSCRNIIITYSPMASLEVKNEDIPQINATVAGHTTSINTITNNVSQLHIQADGISATVSQILQGDTNNLFYPACYNSDGMLNDKNQFFATSYSGSTNKCSDWYCDNLAKYGKPIKDSKTYIEINANTGEVYLYTPWVSLSNSKTYTLTFGGSINNICYLELCRYSSLANAISANQTIASTTSITTLSLNSQYTYNSNVISFTPSTTSKYYRLRFRLTNGISATPALNLNNLSLYEGNISAGGFADWNFNVSKATSVISQEADKISIGVEKAGINLTTGKITSIADNFEWKNNNNETILGINSDGDAEFAGTIKAKNFYHGICLAEWIQNNPSYSSWNVKYNVNGGLYISDKTSFEEDYNIHDLVPSSELAKISTGDLIDLTDTANFPTIISLYYQNYQMDGAVPCIGYADEVIFMTPTSSSGDKYVILPRADKCVGKIVTVYNKSYSSTVIQVKSAYSLDSLSPVAYYSNGQALVSGNSGQSISLNNNQWIKFIALSNGWLAMANGTSTFN